MDTFGPRQSDRRAYTCTARTSSRYAAQPLLFRSIPSIEVMNETLLPKIKIKNLMSLHLPVATIMDDLALEGGLQFVRHVYLCRELAGGVERFCTLTTKNIIEKELANRALFEGKTVRGSLCCVLLPRVNVVVTTRHCHTPLLPPGPLPNCGNPFAVSKIVTDDLAHVTALVLKVCSLCKCKWPF